MRCYNPDLHKRLSQQNRNLQIVCPFPGKNPLRLAWRVGTDRFDEDGTPTPLQEVTYYGKFTLSAWKRFVRTHQDWLNRYGRTFPLYSNWTLWDKARMVLNGYGPTSIETLRNSHGPNRYFYLGIQGRYTQGVDAFQYLRPIRAGRFHLFCRDLEDPTPQQLASYERFISTTIPHVRNI